MFTISTVIRRFQSELLGEGEKTVFINKNAVVAIAAMLSAGALFSNVGQARLPQAFMEMQDFQSRQAGILPSARNGLLSAVADRNDWTASGGALRGSPALRHSDRAHHDQAEKPRRQRSDFEQS
jgi:hypothetical protein